MPKSIHRPEYSLFLQLVKQYRVEAGFMQKEVADRLGHSQSYISDVERGSRRLDILQLRDLCHLYGTTLPKLVADLERQIGSAKPAKKKRA